MRGLRKMRPTGAWIMAEPDEPAFTHISADPVLAAFEKGVEEILAEFQERFADTARNLHWPEDVIRSVVAKYDDETDALVLHQTLPPEVYEALQYGDPNNPPRPAIDNFTNSSSIQRDYEERVAALLDKVSEKLEDSLSEYLDHSLTLDYRDNLISPLLLSLYQMASDGGDEE